VYAVATAGEAGTTVRAVAGALLERLARATGADRAVLALAPDGDDAGGVVAAWDAELGPVPPAEAATFQEAAVIPLVVRDVAVGSLILDGGVDRGMAARLAIPGALALDAARRAEQAAARAERADRLSSLTRDLLSIVSHELRTPLASVIGSLQTLQRTG
jgi:signal transduction histidine kinase